MFGLEDPSIWSAYLLCIVSTLLCFVYGTAKWNKGQENATPEDVAWVKDEKKMEEEM